MDITVKIKFGSSKSHIESFGNNRYLLHVLSKEEDEDAMDEVKSLISKLGVAGSKIELRRKGPFGIWVFQI